MGRGKRAVGPETERLGVVIRDLRKALHLTQRDVWSQIDGLSSTTYSRIENGKVSPETTTLSAIAAILGKSASDLMIEAGL